jgi:hypothetical protein
MHPAYHPSVLELVLGVAVFFAALTFTFCFVTIKDHIDTDQLSKEELARLAKGGLPKKDQLTDVGVFRNNLGIVSLLVAVVLGGAIIIHRSLAGG